MEGNCECSGGCGYVYVVIGLGNSREPLYPLGSFYNLFIFPTGPAHAVYFGTYEAVKQKLGGNVGSEHHPFAVGMGSIVLSILLHFG